MRLVRRSTLAVRIHYLNLIADKLLVCVGGGGIIRSAPDEFTASFQETEPYPVARYPTWRVGSSSDDT